MRVLHVFTLHSSDNAFGGPVRVALNDAQELQRRGHDVTCLALSRGFTPVPQTIEGVPAQLFPARQLSSALGFSGLFNLRLLLWALRRLTSFDVVHVHLARDLVTLPVALLAQAMRVPTVVQTHGMVDPSTKPLARVLDALATRRVLMKASAVLYLTPVERAGLLEIEPSLTTPAFLANGVPPQSAGVVTNPNLVVYAARLQARKRPAVLVESAALLRDRGRSFSVQIAGPDEGELTSVVEAIARYDLGGICRYVGPLEHSRVLEFVGGAAVYVLPSVDEPFPMSVLEALSLGTPVVITDSCGLASHVARANAGVVIDGSAEALASAIETVLDDRAAFSARALRLAQAEFAIAAVVDRLLETYDRARARPL